MTSEEREEQIVKVMESYLQNYLDELKSDLKKYNEEYLRCSIKHKLNPPQKITEFRFEEIAKNFEVYKIRIVEEEIDVWENLDMTILDDLAYIFDSYTFTFSNREDEKPDKLPLSFIDDYMLEPIFNTILYLENLKRKNIEWGNYDRDLENFLKLLKNKLELTEIFFHLIPVQSEEAILRDFLTHMHLRYLEPQQEGIRAIISKLYAKKKNIPKEQEAYMKALLSEAGYYTESKPDITFTFSKK